MAGMGAMALDGFQVPPSSTKLKQRTLFESFGKEKIQRDSREKGSTSQIILDIFGSSSISEDHEEDVDIEDVDTMLQEDMDLVGMSSQTPCLSNNETQGSNNEKKKKLRKFRAEWLHKFSFLKLVVVEDKEFLKCLWCEKYKQKGPWGKGKGCKTIQMSAIKKHKKSPEHRFATLKVLHEGGIKVQEHMKALGSKTQKRVITCMKLMYFIAKEDLACKKFKKLCDLAYALDLQTMPVKNDYSSYTNVMAGKDFATCISEHIKTMQLDNVKQSPFYSLMIDETTDRAMEKHLILYVSYLTCAGLGMVKTQFGKLVVVTDGSAQTKFDALKKALFEMGLDLQRMVGIATDGDSSMLGCHDGLVAKLKREIPHLVSTHCIAHREALAILDATKCFPCFSYIDKVANKIYSWIHGSSLRHTGFQNLLKEMNLQVLEVLQIHDVRWLSRGNVMERLVALLPAILSFWQKEATAWYNKLRICNDDGGNDVESCKQLARSFVQKLIDCVTERFPDVYFLNATKMFSPQFYPKDIKRSKSTMERTRKVNEWLNRLLKKVGGYVVDAQGCNDELLAFTDTLYYACDTMNMRDAWQLFASNVNWQHTYPNLLKLWQLILVLPVSSVSCERGFSKQNAIKTSTRQCLKVDTLDMLMRISLVGPKHDAIDWVSVYKIWELKKCRKATDA